MVDWGAFLVAHGEARGKCLWNCFEKGTEGCRFLGGVSKEKRVLMVLLRKRREIFMSFMVVL